MVWETSFTNALIGGALIGLASSILLLSNGRILGVSGILGTALTTHGKESKWRYSFLGGIILGSLFWGFLRPEEIPRYQSFSWIHVIVAGLLVGFGTRLGSGCTSGHGVCGISRLSIRSITATMLFMVFGILTVKIMGRAAWGF